MLKSIASYVWVNTPAWIKWPIVLIVGPNLTVCAIVFFALIVPFQHDQIRAYVDPINETRDRQIQHIIEVQAIRDQAILETLNRLDRHQSIMFQAMQTRHNVNP